MYNYVDGCLACNFVYNELKQYHSIVESNIGEVYTYMYIVASRISSTCRYVGLLIKGYSNTCVDTYNYWQRKHTCTYVHGVRQS